MNPYPVPDEAPASRGYWQPIAVAATALLGWLCTALAIFKYEEYTFGLFLWLPFVMGFLCTFLASRQAPGHPPQGRFQIVLLTFGIFLLGLLFFAFEGIICIAMAAPIGLMLAYFGYRVCLGLVARTPRPPGTLALLLAASVPALMGFEDAFPPATPLRSVTTSVRIQAPPEAVWRNVVAFPRLREPDEWLFRAGIAYPISATIRGRGVEAVRHCNFSTGSFVEPITRWDENRLLAFDVAQQPEPMREISPYDLHPAHLHGYWVSRRGQFRLLPQADGSTLLEGTTWYTNRIRPDFYWTLWSDGIVHAIHRRVLEHIKTQAEASN